MATHTHRIMEVPEGVTMPMLQLLAWTDAETGSYVPVPSVDSAAELMGKIFRIERAAHRFTRVMSGVPQVFFVDDLKAIAEFAFERIFDNLPVDVSSNAHVDCQSNWTNAVASAALALGYLRSLIYAAERSIE